MQPRKLTIAFGAADQAQLVLVLLAVLREEFLRQHRELDSLLEQARVEPAELLRLIEISHDLGEQTDHLLLAIARNEAAQHLREHAEGLFDGFRSIEATAEAALEQQRS